MNKTIPILIISLFAIGPSQKLSAQPLDIQNAANETLLRVANNGNVGIGTSTPERVLHVKAVANEIARFETTAAGGNSFLSLRNGTGQFANLGRFKSGANDYFFLDLDGGGFGEFIVTNSGKVGIGTTSPLAQLHLVNGSAGFAPNAATELAIESSGNTEIHVMSPANSAGIISFGSPTESDRGFITYKHSTDIMLIGSGGQTSMVIAGNGDVGIGTTAPQGRLDVNGSIFQHGSLLHADYVFEPDYKLESIAEHAEFIWKNKHLNAIPKAKVDDNGLEIIEVGAHRRGIVEELEKAHIYIDQLYQNYKVLEERVAKLDELRTQNMTIKEHHKTLEARLAKLEVPLNVGSITASEIAQEQATSAAANQARIDRELAAMRARIEKLERDQGKGQQGSNRQ